MRRSTPAGQRAGRRCDTEFHTRRHATTRTGGTIARNGARFALRAAHLTLLEMDQRRERHRVEIDAGLRRRRGHTRRTRNDGLNERTKGSRHCVSPCRRTRCRIRSRQASCRTMTALVSICASPNQADSPRDDESPTDDGGAPTRTTELSRPESHDRQLSGSAPVATTSSAMSRSLRFVFWDARTRRANASSPVMRCVAMRMPLA